MTLRQQVYELYFGQDPFQTIYRTSEGLLQTYMRLDSASSLNHCDHGRFF